MQLDYLIIVQKCSQLQQGSGPQTNVSRGGGNWPKFSTKAERISTAAGCFCTLGFANFLWSPETVARTNGDSEIGGRPEICRTQLTAFTASSTADLDIQ